MRHLKNTASVLLIAFATVIGIYAQGPTVKVFFEQIPNQKTGPSHSELLQATDQIPRLSKQEVQDLLPILLADLKYDNDVGLAAALGLYNIALRPDSGELVKPRLADIGALYGRSDTRFKATANMVLATMKPRAPEAVPLLVRFVMGPTGTPNEKADTLAVLLDISPSAPEAEPSALHLLNMPMDTRTRAFALVAAARPGATNKVIDRIADDLANSDERVQIAAIQALALLGKAAVARHSADLSKMTATQSLSATVRRLAQDVLDGKDTRCTTLQGAPIKPCTQ
jgi:hypothetical protein